MALYVLWGCWLWPTIIIIRNDQDAQAMTCSWHEQWFCIVEDLQAATQTTSGSCVSFHSARHLAELHFAIGPEKLPQAYGTKV